MIQVIHTDEHAGHHITSPKLYVINAIVIAILMVLTVAFAKYEPLSSLGSDHPNGLGFLIALVIAIAKCGCIIAIFMGVWWNTPIVKMFALGVVGWLALLFMFTMIDVASPDWGKGPKNPDGLGSPYADLENQGVNPLYPEPEAPAKN